MATALSVASVQRFGRGPTKLKVLKTTHPTLDLAYCERLMALYKGGRRLLQNPTVMRTVFPQHALESNASYRERCSRAFYDNDYALVINQVSAGLAQDPFTFDDGGAKVGKEGTEIPPYWKELLEDVRPPDSVGSPKCTMDQQERATAVVGMVQGWAWTLCDLPRPITDDNGQLVAQTALDQDRMDARRAYPVMYRADQVHHWGEHGNRITWLRTFEAAPLAGEPEQDVSAWTSYTWRVWDDNSITTYNLVLNGENKDRAGQKYDDDSVVMPTEVVPHTFGVVPWVRMDFSGESEETGTSLWIGDLIESRCRQLFNGACADEFMRLRAAFQQLYEFLGKEMGSPDVPISENQEDPNRASRSMSNRAPDIIQVRGAEDDAKFVCPDMGASSINRQALQEGRESIPRITGQLALASDTAGAIIKRSGDSKAMDAISQRVLMGSVGKIVLAHACAVCAMLARGRGDKPDSVPHGRGYEKLTIEDAASRIEERVALAGAPFNSATARAEHEIMCIRTVLGDAVDDEVMAKIREEVESTVTQDAINQANMPPVPPGHQLDETGRPVPLPPRTEPEGSPVKRMVGSKAKKK